MNEHNIVDSSPMPSSEQEAIEHKTSIVQQKILMESMTKTVYNWVLKNLICHISCPHTVTINISRKKPENLPYAANTFNIYINGINQEENEQ